MNQGDSVQLPFESRLRPWHPGLVLMAGLLGSATWAVWSSIHFSGPKLERNLLYVVPIVCPFVTYWLDRAGRLVTTPRWRVVLDADITLTAMWKVIGDVPLISGHALFLSYATMTAHTRVTFVVTLIALLETLYLKIWVWHDWVTLSSGLLLGVGAGLLAWAGTRLERPVSLKGPSKRMQRSARSESSSFALDTSARAR